jgi:hypothetical protein
VAREAQAPKGCGMSVLAMILLAVILLDLDRELDKYEGGKAKGKEPRNRSVKSVHIVN